MPCDLLEVSQDIDDKEYSMDFSQAKISQPRGFLSRDISVTHA